MILNLSINKQGNIIYYYVYFLANVHCGGTLFVQSHIVGDFTHTRKPTLEMYWHGILGIQRRSDICFFNP